MSSLYKNFKPVFPEFESPVPGHGAACGLSYHEWLEVRAPYGDVDQYANSLPVIYGDMLLGSRDAKDFEGVLTLALSPKVRESISEGLDGAREMAKNYLRDNFLDNKNNAEASKLLNRADDYLKKARRIQDHWEDAWVGNDLANGWPLEQEEHPVCKRKSAPEKVKTLTMGPKGATTIEVTCPSKKIYEDHDADRKLMVNLVQAALFNTRCAQEIIASVGTYNRNKKFYEDQKSSTPGFAGLKDDSGVIPGVTMAVIGDIDWEGAPPSRQPPVDDSDDDDDGISLPEPDVGGTESKKKRSKRGGNSGVVIGAAIAGIFIAGRKGR